MLYIVQLPPPVHGVSAMNQYVVNSPLLNETFAKEVIALRFSKDNTQLEKASLGKALLIFTFAWKIIKTMVSQKPKLVYFTFMPTGFAFYRDALYVLLLKLFPARVVLHLHGKGVQRTIKAAPWRKHLYRLVFRNTHVISLSNILSADMATVYQPKPFLVANGVQPHPWAGPKRPEEENEVPHLLFLSNYIENKGVLVLLKALDLLQKKGHRFQARFVGAPTNLSIETLNNIVLESGLQDFVEIAGPRYGEEKYKELRKADLFVFPTYNDAFPLVTLEAMQFALPVISTDEGGVPDIVNDGETGFLVPRQNVEKLAEKIGLLLQNEALRKTMGQNGYERFCRHFTLQHFEQNLKRTLTTVLTASKN